MQPIRPVIQYVSKRDLHLIKKTCNFRAFSCSSLLEVDDLYSFSRDQSRDQVPLNWKLDVDGKIFFLRLEFFFARRSSHSFYYDDESPYDGGVDGWIVTIDNGATFLTSFLACVARILPSTS